MNLNRRIVIGPITSRYVFEPDATIYWPRGFDYADAVRWTANRFSCWSWTTSYQCEVMV